MEVIKLSSEASVPLGMRGPEKRHLELQRFFPIFGQPIPTILAQFFDVREYLFY